LKGRDRLGDQCGKETKIFELNLNQRGVDLWVSVDSQTFTKFRLSSKNIHRTNLLYINYAHPRICHLMKICICTTHYLCLQRGVVNEKCKSVGVPLDYPYE
jgi:hypothetical protein